MRWSGWLAVSAFIAAAAIAGCNNELGYSSPVANHVPPSPPPTDRPPSVMRHSAHVQSIGERGGRSLRVVAR